jgi:hypothetical protein
MTSAKQIAANQANAKKSTGPNTEEGKNQSKLNAWRHGITSQVNVLPEPDRVAFKAFCEEMTASFHPATPIERQLAQSISEDSWRLNRTRAIENNIFALGHFGDAGNFTTEIEDVHGALTAARTFLENPEPFRLISLYVQRTSREIQRNLATLRQVQQEREAQRLAELEEAAVLLEACRAEGVAYDLTSGAATTPGPNGFVFSTPEIDLFIVRKRRLAGLQIAPKTPLKRAA